MRSVGGAGTFRISLHAASGLKGVEGGNWLLV